MLHMHDPLNRIFLLYGIMITHVMCALCSFMCACAHAAHAHSASSKHTHTNTHTCNAVHIIVVGGAARAHIPADERGYFSAQLPARIPPLLLRLTQLNERARALVRAAVYDWADVTNCEMWINRFWRKNRLVQLARSIYYYNV